MASKAPVNVPVQPIISKNEYFTHTGSHRDADQVWNVDNIAIWVQGTFAGAPEKTYFAKKHLLTFKGGKAEKRGDKLEYKGEEVFDKRTFAKKGSKYGATKIDPDTGKSTYIICDKMTAAELKSAFATAIKKAAKQNKHVAEIDFGRDMVWTLNADYSWEFGSKCKVEFWNDRTKTKFLVKHYKGV